MRRAALHEGLRLRVANLLFDFGDGEFAREVELVVQILHAQHRDVVEKFRVGAFFLVDDVGQREEFLARVEKRFVHAHEARRLVRIDRLNLERDEGVFDDFGNQPVVAQPVEQIEDVGHLARIDDAQRVEIPAHGIADFLDPPVHVFAEADDAPSQLRRGFAHSVFSF